MTFNPELLAPAGNLEKLKVAVLYGADAVYLSGQRFGMRAGADNFTNADLERGMAFAKKHGVKVYVTINTFFHDEDFEGLAEFCQFLESQGVAGAIVSDLGVVEYIRKHSNVEVHVSTQSSCLNTEAARVWKDAGATRIVVGRELSIEQTRRIKEAVGVEVEMFIHGARCMAYSGNCVISNFTAGRDSNRGGCIQSCRYKYTQTAKKGLTVLNDTTASSHFISSKDMMGVDQIPHFIEAQIDSLKIEGRMKSVLYVATTTSAYRRAINAVKNGSFTTEYQETLLRDLQSVPHREYIPVQKETPLPSDSTYEDHYGTIETGTHRFVGLVLEQSKDLLAIRSNTTMTAGTPIEFIDFSGRVISVTAPALYDCTGTMVNKSKPGAVICIPMSDQLTSLKPFNVVRERGHVV
jgi:putative protease